MWETTEPWGMRWHLYSWVKETTVFVKPPNLQGYLSAWPIYLRQVLALQLKAVYNFSHRSAGEASSHILFRQQRGLVLIFLCWLLACLWYVKHEFQVSPTVHTHVFATVKAVLRIPRGPGDSEWGERWGISSSGRRGEWLWAWGVLGSWGEPG